MIDGDHGLSITKQAKALGISRGSVYYRPCPVSPEDLTVMRRIDELHLEFPFAGSRMLRDLLNREGYLPTGSCEATGSEHGRPRCNDGLRVLMMDDSLVA